MNQSEDENLLRDIKREFRKNNLDNSLLFLCSLIGIIFSLLEIFIGGLQSVIYFIPILILAVFFPFFHGYIRGTIIFDSPIERVRGWIFLEFGIFMYIFNLINHIIEIFYPEKNPIKIIPIIILFFIGYMLAILEKYTSSWIFDICRAKKSDLDNEIISYCSNSVMYLSIGAAILVFSQSIMYEKFLLYSSFVMGIFFLFSGVYFYKRSYYFQKRIGHPYYVTYKKGRKKIVLFGMIIFIIGLFGSYLLLQINLDINLHIENIILIILQGIEFVGIFLFVIFSSKKAIIFEDIVQTKIYKKEVYFLFLKTFFPS